MYHTLGVRGFRYRSTDYPAGKTVIHLEHDPERWRCDGCGSDRGIGAGQVAREFQAVPIGSRPTILRLNAPLATAYYLKEDLRQLWEQPDKATAERFFDDWLVRTRASGIRILCKLANTLQLHRTGPLAWYDHPISTGPLEGTNNKIKTMQRQAYGSRDQEYFHLRIRTTHLTRCALVG